MRRVPKRFLFKWLIFSVMVRHDGDHSDLSYWY